MVTMQGGLTQGVQQQWGCERGAARPSAAALRFPCHTACSMSGRISVVAARGAWTKGRTFRKCCVSALQQSAADAGVIVGAPAALHPAPFASVTRIFMIGHSSNIFRAVAARRPPTGPISLLLFIFAMIGTVVAAIRNSIVRKTKSCSQCKGFGIQRCSLCNGTGKVDWRAKLSHFECCPLCMNRRFVECRECGGHYHRVLFRHHRREKAEGDMFGQVDASSMGTRPPERLAFD